MSRMKTTQIMQEISNLQGLPAHVRARQSDSTIEYMGGVVMFLAEAEDTDGGFAKSAFLSKLGNDPRSVISSAITASTEASRQRSKYQMLLVL
jgi:hypothetical protein